MLLALDRLGLREQARRTLFVGDSPFDLRAGRAAGTRTAAVLWGPFPHEVLRAEEPDYEVRTAGGARFGAQPAEVAKSTCSASARSFSVIPPALWVESMTVTRS